MNARVGSMVLAAGGTTLAAMQEIRGIEGSLKTITRMRYAAVSIERPGTWADSANERTSANVYGEDVTLSVEVTPIANWMNDKGEETIECVD